MSLSRPMTHGHASALIPLVQSVLTQAGATFETIGLVAVTTGPGSFTGIRTGLSAARALALAVDAPVTGFTTLEVLAYQAVSRLADTAFESLCVAIDSRRDEVFFQFFAKDGRTPLCAPAIGRPETIDSTPFGTCLLIGDAAAQCLGKAQGALTGCDAFSAIDPACLAEMAIVSEIDASIKERRPALSPFYLREPDATCKPNTPPVSAE